MEGEKQVLDICVVGSRTKNSKSCTGVALTAARPMGLEGMIKVRN
jgi:hypothetical protein